MRSPERQLREQMKDSRGRYKAYAVCEWCKACKSSGLTVLVLKADGSHHWEGYACNPCRKVLRQEAASIGGTIEDGDDEA